MIELKSTKTTDLESIKKQAFSYKNNQPDCRYVITSNFEKLRFYIDNATEYEEFNLFKLSPKQFTFLYLILSKESIFSGLPVKLKDESRLHEESVSDKLYKDYSSFKRNVFNNLVKNNPQQEKLFLFHKSQKLLDRLLFVLFAEDRGLIPPNAISKIIDQWKKLAELDEPVSLYSRFVKLFHHLDEGHKYPNYELAAYNGGLFRKDKILDSIIIDDDILHKDTLKLSSYDFNTEIDVNILGHIFEHSINEIEELTAELEGKEANRNKSKRKKEGIFYTPKFIAKYIVENTVGALCEEKKKELKIDEIETEIIKNSRTVKGKLTKKAEELLKRLEAYRNYLVSLKILDPACGSGAFLNQALEFLINEHEMIDSYRKELEQDALGLYDISKSILENNLYGVDINEEAVEIAKLSLWLRTAEKGRKLSDLSTNLKCGNSLIDDPEVAGNKAFKWEEEFPQIFSNSHSEPDLSGKESLGFDVVIGNPPYVKVQNLAHEEVDWYKDNKVTAHKRIDISILFFELAKQILKTNGLVSLITSNQFLVSEYGRKLRKFFLNNFQIKGIVDFGDLPIFEDALTYVSIFTLCNSVPSNFKYAKIDNIDDATSGNYNSSIVIEHSKLSNDPWMLFSKPQYQLLQKLKKFPSLSDVGSKCWYGIISGNDSIFILDESDLNKFKFEKDILLPLIRANDCSRYGTVTTVKYIIYPYKLDNNETVLIPFQEIENKYKNLYRYLLSKKKLLENRKDSRKTFIGKDNWYSLTRFGRLDIFNRDKIVFPGESKQNKFGIDKSKAGYSGARVFSVTVDEDILNLYFLLSILNSKIIEFYLHSIAALKQGGYYSYSSTVINSVPITNCDDKKGAQLILIADKMLQLNKKLQEKINSFLSRIQSNFSIEKLSKKLKDFYNYDFKTFLTELKKKKITLTLQQQDEWEPYFNKYKDEINSLQEEINKTDGEIDQMVYRLYGLTDEEIKIVEESTS